MLRSYFYILRTGNVKIVLLNRFQLGTRPIYPIQEDFNILASGRLKLSTKEKIIVYNT